MKQRGLMLFKLVQNTEILRLVSIQSEPGFVKTNSVKESSISLNQEATSWASNG
jgi:hypothetical protein